jgi:hypothetical protein
LPQPHSHAHSRADRGRRARRRPWRRPRLRRVPHRDAPVAANPYASRGSLLAGAHCLARAVMHALTRLRTSRVTFSAAASTSPRPRRRRPHATVLTPDLHPFEPSSLGGSLWLPSWPVTQASWNSPPARSPRVAVFLLGFSSNTWSGRCRRVWAVHRRPHAGVATADPPGSAAARPPPSRPPVGPHRTEPHGSLAGSRAVANGGPATRGPQAARPHPIRGNRCGWACLRG